MFLNLLKFIQKNIGLKYTKLAIFAVEQVIDIEILDENDNPPRFDPSRYIHQMPEGLPVGAPVMSVFAADADTGENARLVYRILSPGADELFYMDSLYSAQAGLIRIREVRTHRYYLCVMHS